MKSVISFLVAWCWAIALSSSASAQVQTTTSITGTITDPAGAVVPSVPITVRNENTALLDSRGSVLTMTTEPRASAHAASYSGFEISNNDKGLPEAGSTGSRNLTTDHPAALSSENHDSRVLKNHGIAALNSPSHP